MKLSYNFWERPHGHQLEQCQCTQTCDIVLGQQILALEQFHLHNFIHEVWINPEYGFQTLSNGAACWDHLCRLIFSKSHLLEKSTLVRFELLLLQPKIKIWINLRFLPQCPHNMLLRFSMYIEKTFRLLHCIHHFILYARKWADKIHKTKKISTTDNKKTQNLWSYSSTLTKFKNHLSPDTRIVTTTTTIRELFNRKHQTNTISDPRIYNIKCLQCSESYIAETSRALKVCIYENKRDFCWDNLLNSLIAGPVLGSHQRPPPNFDMGPPYLLHVNLKFSQLGGHKPLKENW